MESFTFTEGLLKSIETSKELNQFLNSSRIIMLIEALLDWEHLKKVLPESSITVATMKHELLEGIEAAGFHAIYLSENSEDDSVNDRLSKALQVAIAKNYFSPGESLVVLYSGFDTKCIDSLSLLATGEQIERVNWRLLKKINTTIPYKTLKAVVSLAMEIGREGREGKAVGTMFVVGDTKKVMESSRPAGFDPVRGYTCKERNLCDPVVREGIKEVAQLDGAFVVSRDGIVRAACRLLNAPTARVVVSKGLGSRHWAAAAISKVTEAIAVVVSQSDSMVRLFQEGICVVSFKGGNAIYHEDERETAIFGQSSLGDSREEQWDINKLS